MKRADQQRETAGRERPPVVIRAAGKGKKPPLPSWDEETRYAVLGWVGVVLLLAALSDYALALYPLGFGSPEWELATIGAIVQGLPLFSIGLAALWASAAMLAKRWLLRLVGWGALLLVLALLAALLVFITDVPLGLKATEGVARIGIEKLAAKTLFLGLLFGVFYVLVGVLALKQTRAA